jgi:hypothetical protein
VMSDSYSLESSRTFMQSWMYAVYFNDSILLKLTERLERCWNDGSPRGRGEALNLLASQEPHTQQGSSLFICSSRGFIRSCYHQSCLFSYSGWVVETQIRDQTHRQGKEVVQLSMHETVVLVPSYHDHDSLQKL